MANDSEKPEQSNQDQINVISAFANETKSITQRDNDLAKQELNHKFKDGERGEKFRKHLYYLVLTGIYVVAICLMVMIIIRVWHFVVPDCWKWLDEEHTHDLERIIFSGVIVSLAGSYFKRYSVIEKQ